MMQVNEGNDETGAGCWAVLMLCYATKAPGFQAFHVEKQLQDESQVEVTMD